LDVENDDMKGFLNVEEDDTKWIVKILGLKNSGPGQVTVDFEFKIHIQPF